MEKTGVHVVCPTSTDFHVNYLVRKLSIFHISEICAFNHPNTIEGTKNGHIRLVTRSEHQKMFEVDSSEK